jgi:Mg2+ and Co2+ transporter CorA
MREAIRMQKRRVIVARAKVLSVTARRASESAEDHTIREYHRLVDKRLKGIATPEDLAGLEQVKSKMQSIADAQTSHFDGILQQRHNAIMEKLSSLTDELRRFSSAAEQ